MILRKWYVVVAAMLLAALLVVVGLLVRGPSYSSSSLVRVVLSPGVDPTIASQVGSTGNEEAGRVLATQQEVVLSDAVVAQAAASLGWAPAVVRDAIVVSPGQGADTLTITGSSDSPKDAQEVSAALATAYVGAGKSAGSKQLDDSAAAMDAQLATLEAQRDLLDPSSRDPAIQAERASIQVQYNALLLQQQSLLAQAAAYPGNAFILNDAPLPVAPSSMSLPVGIALGLALGLIIGVALLLLRGTRPLHIPIEKRLAKGIPPSPGETAQRMASRDF